MECHVYGSAASDLIGATQNAPLLITADRIAAAQGLKGAEGFQPSGETAELAAAQGESVGAVQSHTGEDIIQPLAQLVYPEIGSLQGRAACQLG